MTTLCRSIYVRDIPGQSGMGLECQYIKGHPSDRHSWYAVEQQDIVDAEKAAADEQQRWAQMNDEVVSDLLEDIRCGKWDSFLEALLSAAHDRKRTLRGVRGFPRLERRRA